MEKVVMYRALDKRMFETREECIKHDEICETIQSIDAMLKPHTKDISACAIKQDLIVVGEVYERLMRLCIKLFPKFDYLFDECRRGERHKSHAERIIMDYVDMYPTLYALFYRLMSIDEKSGIEYDQPFYADNPEAWKGEII